MLPDGTGLRKRISWGDVERYIQTAQDCVPVSRKQSKEGTTKSEAVKVIVT